MRKFNEVYNTSKKQVVEQKRAKADAERVELVGAIRRHYGISSFNTLSESEKSKYRSMILEMWDQNTGLNKKGIKFINEGNTLSAESSKEDIIAFLKDDFNNNFMKYLADILNGVETAKFAPTAQEALKKGTGKDMGDVVKKFFLAYLKSKLKK